MEQSALLTEEQRRLFRNDFFGRLVVETKPDFSKAFFADENPDAVEWGAWEILTQEGRSLTIRYKLEDEWLVRSVRVEGDCYRVEQPHLGFGEWFCKEPEM